MKKQNLWLGGGFQSKRRQGDLCLQAAPVSATRPKKTTHLFSNQCCSMLPSSRYKGRVGYPNMELLHCSSGHFSERISSRSDSFISASGCDRSSSITWKQRASCQFASGEAGTRMITMMTRTPAALKGIDLQQHRRILLSTNKSP